MPTTPLGMLETTGRVDTQNMHMAAKFADPLEGTRSLLRPHFPYSPSLNFPK